MSIKAIAIIEPDFSFLKKLSAELNQFGYVVYPRTEIRDLTDILEFEGQIQAFILNLELKESEGLAVYASLRKHFKYSKSRFIFLADETDLFNLVKNMELEDAIMLDKSRSFDFLMEEILNFLPPVVNETAIPTFSSVAEGSLSEISFSQLMQFCKETGFSGNLSITVEATKATLLIQKGKIFKIYFGELSQELALNKLRRLQAGTFKLEQKIYSEVDLKAFILSENNNSLFSLKDLMVDLFYYLFDYFSKKIDEATIENIFSQKFAEYRLNFAWFDQIQYTDIEQERVVLNIEPDEDQTEILLLLFKELLLDLSLQTENFSQEEFLGKLEEIRPYLDQYKLWSRLIASEPFDFVT